MSLESVTCVVCHRRKHGQYKNNGRLVAEPGDLLEACMFGPFDDSVSANTSHPSAGFPYIKSSQFCGDCHDVTAANGVRNEEAFSEWANSPAAKDGITCQNCHMGPVQGIPIADKDRPWGPAAVVPGVPVEKMPVRPLSDHTFAGPDYSLLPDTEFPFKLDWMYEVDYRDDSKLTPYQFKTLEELRAKTVSRCGRPTRNAMKCSATRPGSALLIPTARPEGIASRFMWTCKAYLPATVFPQASRRNDKSGCRSKSWGRKGN